MGVDPLPPAHLRVRPTGVRRTCRRAGETKKNTHPKNITAVLRGQACMFSHGALTEDGRAMLDRWVDEREAIEAAVSQHRRTCPRCVWRWSWKRGLCRTYTPCPPSPHLYTHTHTHPPAPPSPAPPMPSLGFGVWHVARP